MTVAVLAYYILTPIEEPEVEVARHKAFFKGRDAMARIYIAREGINGQMSASHADAEAFMAWMRSDPRFAETEFKIQLWHEHPFPRMTVKVREQLVAMDCPVDLANGARHVSPAEWREMLESGRDLLKIDVRNDYEWDLGHFEGFDRPECETFRQFPEFVEKLKKSRDPAQTDVMICCTGGIRCEFYGPLLKEAGFRNVYQLQGGIIKYAEQERGKHWKGRLFVFDDRLGVPVNPDDDEIIGKCRHCSEPSDHFANCANVECNELFLCCPSCLERNLGCCSEACAEAPRVRDYREATFRPFRRLNKSCCDKS